MFIEEFLTDELSESINSYKYTNYGGKVVYVESIKDLLVAEDELVVIKLKKGELQVSGKNLKINELGKGSIVLKGNISKIETIIL